MNIENLIEIKGGAYKDIKKALRQWIDLYSTDNPAGLTFHLSENEDGNHIIHADGRLNNENFFYLINYLKYPEDISYKIDIEGFTTGKENAKWRGKKLLVYISATDNEYDNVCISTSDNESFKVDFSGKITETRKERSFNIPNITTLEFKETIYVKKKQDFIPAPETIKSNLEKRFKIISIIVIAVFSLTYLFFKADDKFLTINSMIAFAVWGWLAFDYTILQVDRLYFGAFMLSILIFIYGLYLENNLSYEGKTSIVLEDTTMPIFFLILQRPMRFAFKKIMNREPIVDKHAPSFADFVYIFILWMSSITIPALYYHGLKET